MTLPNKLTTFRLLCVPLLIIVYLIPDLPLNITFPTVVVLTTEIPVINIVCFVLFLLICFTDTLDGYFARKSNQISTFGQFVDPIADKLIVNSSLLLLCYSGKVSVIIPIIMIGRDTFVDAIRMVAMSKNEVLAASYFGKAKTVTQMFAIGLLLLNNVVFAYFNIPMDQILIIAATIISILSGIDYFMKNKDYILESI